MEVSTDLRDDAAGVKAVMRFRDLYPKFPLGMNYQQIVDGFQRFEHHEELRVFVAREPLPDASSAVLSPSWQLFDMEPALAAYYGIIVAC